jgi:hypothetical protein
MTKTTELILTSANKTSRVRVPADRLSLTDRQVRIARKWLGDGWIHVETLDGSDVTCQSNVNEERNGYTPVLSTCKPRCR